MSKPMRERNLPASFFTPPETGTRSASHSRESSIDQVKRPYLKPILITNNGSTNQLENKQHQIIINQHPKLLLNRTSLPISHSRAHSSPATLQKTLSVVPQQTAAQMNQNNQNAINQQQVTNTNVQQQTIQQQQTVQPNVMRINQQQQTIQHIRQLSDISQIPLPEGWEEAIDHSTGRSYFINHNEKNTQWEDPRLATQQHQLRLLQIQQSELEQQKQQQLQAQLQQQIQQQQIIQQQQQQILQQQQSNQQQQIIQISTTNNIIQTGKLPDGWVEKRIDKGETYFINHNDHSSTWFDPRIPMQLQKQTMNRPPPQLTQPQQATNQQTVTITNGELIQQQQNLIQQQQTIQQQQANNAQQTIQQTQQIIIQQQPTQSQQIIQPDDLQLRLQQLQFERDNLRQRAVELRSQIANNTNQITTTGMDPFLSGNTLTTGENHSRQESADSGLGLSSNYSLPNTPEDMLDNDVDLNDCSNYVHEDLGLDSLVISTMDLDENMESDDLLPNLPDEINCPDIQLADVDAILASNSNIARDWI